MHRFHGIGMIQAAWMAAALLVSAPLLAGGDPDLGMSRSLGIEEAWVENSAYLTAGLDDDTSAGNTLGLAGEAEFAFNPSLGGEVDFPGVVMRQPLGAAPSTLAPLALGLRAVALRFGDDASPQAGLLSLEAEGSYWIKPQTAAFPDLGSALTAEGMAGWRWGRVFAQGEYGYNSALGGQGSPGWFANTSLGFRAGLFRPQVEADFAGQAPADDAPAAQCTLVPQLGLDAGDWYWEAGEGFTFTPGEAGSRAQTLLLVERDL